MADFLPLPWQHNFPPFFTMQPHSETRKKQLEVWRFILLNYCRLEKRCIIDVADNTDNLPPVFTNNGINRSLSKDDVLILLEYLADCANAEPMDAKKRRWLVYWRTLNDWADTINQWVDANGLHNTVCTLYELLNNPDEEFSKLNETILKKVLRILESRNKAQLILSDEMSGVKFL